MGDLSPHFNREEFQCKCGCGQDVVDAERIVVLEDVREYFNKPITINSGNRCGEYNKSIGGSIHSQHLRSKAADIVVKDVAPAAVYTYLSYQYPNKYGLGSYTTFIHIDVRGGEARWNG